MYTVAFIILAVAFLFSQIFDQSSFDERSRFANFNDDNEESRLREPWNWRRQEREWERRYEDYQERRRDRGAAWATLIVVVLGVVIYLAYLH
ncbi:MAG: hypothetical protein H7246_06490 [Phycisphaerae bacterium]|nr:hypothetical protein [Saprospiraceae bacterium]